MIYLSLGSNLGDRAAYLKEACYFLAERNVHISRISSFYETSPVGLVDQPDFLNIVIAVETIHSPEQLLAICLDIENQLGRVRVKKWGPRIVDIDLLLYHDEVRQSERLTLPHPFFTQRRFVLKPLAEIAGENPIYQGKTAQELLEELTDTDFVNKITIPFRVLFLSVPIGAGHVKAAQAVEQRLRLEAESFPLPLVTTSYNLFDFLPKGFVKIFLTCYLALLRLCPTIYGKAYEWGNNDSTAFRGRSYLNRLLAKPLSQAIIECKPDLIVATHATAAGVATELLAEHKICVPIWAVITDFVVHRLWIYREVARYFVADERLAEVLIKRNMAAEKIVVTGIPVGKEFTHKEEKVFLRQKMGLHYDHPVILLMGGGDGLLPLKKMAANLDQVPNEFQLVIVTGRNYKAKEQLETFARGARHRIIVYGYVDNMAEIMQSADCIITKAGGVTLAEALALALPIIIYKPLPGQEQGNAQYLVQKQLAVVAESFSQLCEIFAGFLTNSMSIQALRFAMEKQRKPEAAKRIAQEICEKINNFFKIT